MNKIAESAAAVLILSLTIAGSLNAQLSNAAGPGTEIGQATIKLGVLSPRTTFTDDSFGESSFGDGMAIGLQAAAWPMFGNRVGVRGELVRSETDGKNEQFEFAPIAVNDPTVYLFTLELAVRQPVTLANIVAVPFLSGGYGGKHYTWAISQHKSSRFGTWTAATGLDLRPTRLGSIGITTELRAYGSTFRGFGIDDGTWAPGFYGGDVGGVNNLDMLLSTGISLNF
jgi:hypothetical protein